MKLHFERAHYTPKCINPEPTLRYTVVKSLDFKEKKSFGHVGHNKSKKIRSPPKLCFMPEKGHYIFQ